MINDTFSTLGVVPLFVNAGAALGPMIIAPIATFFAALFKPRLLLAMIRRKPWLPLVWVGAGACVWYVSTWALATTPTPPRPAQGASTKRDWTAIALKIIEAQEMASKKTGIKPGWDYDPNEGRVLTRPVVGNGRVYAAATVQDGDKQVGMVFALNQKTGEEIWQAVKSDAGFFKPIFSSPALSTDGKSLIVGQGFHPDTDCDLLCFDTETGQLRWKVRTPLHIESSPVIFGDMVIVGAGAIEDAVTHKPKSHPGYVFAVRISDGKELWRHDVVDPESSPAVASDGTVYIGSGFNGNAVVALRSDPEDQLKAKGLKREIWKVQAPYPVTGPVTLAGDLILVGGGRGDFVYEDPNPAGVVMAINRADGAIKWEAKKPSAVLGRIAVSDGRAFCPVRNGQVVAVELADGKTAWEQSISGNAAVLAGVTVADGVVYAVSKDGMLALMSAASGQIIDRQSVNGIGKSGKDGMSVSTPTVVGDWVFVGSENGGLRAFVAAGSPSTQPAASASQLPTGGRQ